MVLDVFLDVFCQPAAFDSGRAPSVAELAVDFLLRAFLAEVTLQRSPLYAAVGALVRAHERELTTHRPVLSRDGLVRAGIAAVRTRERALRTVVAFVASHLSSGKPAAAIVRTRQLNEPASISRAGLRAKVIFQHSNLAHPSTTQRPFAAVHLLAQHDSLKILVFHEPQRSSLAEGAAFSHPFQPACRRQRDVVPAAARLARPQHHVQLHRTEEVSRRLLEKIVRVLFVEGRLAARRPARRVAARGLVGRRCRRFAVIVIFGRRAFFPVQVFVGYAFTKWSKETPVQRHPHPPPQCQ